jgi:hypothetical protein
MVSSSHERGKHWYNLNISKQAKALQISSHHDSQSIVPRILKESIGGNVICQQSPGRNSFVGATYNRYGRSNATPPANSWPTAVQPIPPWRLFVLTSFDSRWKNSAEYLPAGLAIIFGCWIDSWSDSSLPHCSLRVRSCCCPRDRIPMVPIVGWFFNCQWNESWAPRKSGIHVRYSWVLFLHTEEKLVY